MRRSRAVMLALVTSVGAAAQEPIRPAAIAGHGLPLRSDTVDAYIDKTNPRTWFGYYVYAVSRVKSGGTDLLLVTTNYTSKERGTYQSDTLALAAATLDPLWRRFHARTDSASVIFSNGHASGWSLQNGRRVTVDHTLSVSAFAAPMLRWIAASLPLGENYQGEITTFSIWGNAEGKAVFRVTGSESVDRSGKKVDAWVLVSPSGSRTWIEKESGRVLQSFAAEGGRSGYWLVLR